MDVFMDTLRIFQEHVQRFFKEWNFTRQQLADVSGVSYGIICGIVNGSSDNLTLKTMQSVADALEIPLPLLLKPLDSDEWKTILAITKFDALNRTPILPSDYTILKNVVLPCHKAAIVLDWCKQADKELEKQMRDKRLEEKSKKSDEGDEPDGN